MSKIHFGFLICLCIISFIIAIKYWKEKALLGVIQFIITTVLTMVTIGLQLWPQKAADWIPSFSEILKENTRLTNQINANNQQIEQLAEDLNNLKSQLPDMNQNAIQNNEKQSSDIKPSNEENTSFQEDIEIHLSAPELQIAARDVNIFSITWNPINDAKGYELYYSTNGKNYKILAKTENTKYIHKNLKENTKYYYKVRAYVDNTLKTTYSKYSKVQKKKCTYYLIDFYSAYETKNTDIYSKNSAYNEYKDGATFTMGGNEYSNGFVFGYTDWYNGSDYANRNMSAFFNLEGKYRSISFTYACIDGHAQDSSIKLYADDECVKELKFGPGDLPTTKTVHIENANKLEIAVYGNHIGFGNVKLYN